MVQAPTDCNFSATLVQFINFQALNLILDNKNFMEIIRVCRLYSPGDFWNTDALRQIDRRVLVCANVETYWRVHNRGRTRRMEVELAHSSWYCSELILLLQGRKSELSEFEISNENDGKKMITLRTSYQLEKKAKPLKRGWRRNQKFNVKVWFHKWTISTLSLLYLVNVDFINDIYVFDTLQTEWGQTESILRFKCSAIQCSGLRAIDCLREKGKR